MNLSPSYSVVVCLTLLVSSPAEAVEDSAANGFFDALHLLDGSIAKTLPSKLNRLQAAKHIEKYCENISEYFPLITPAEKDWLSAEKVEIAALERSKNIQAYVVRSSALFRSAIYGQDRIKNALSACSSAARMIQLKNAKDERGELTGWAMLEVVLMEKANWEEGHFKNIRSKFGITKFPLGDEQYSDMHYIIAMVIAARVVLPYLQGSLPSE